MSRGRARLAALALAVGLAVTGCGSDGAGNPGGPGAKTAGAKSGGGSAGASAAAVSSIKVTVAGARAALPVAADVPPSTTGDGSIPGAYTVSGSPGTQARPCVAAFGQPGPAGSVFDSVQGTVDLPKPIDAVEPPRDHRFFETRVSLYADERAAWARIGALLTATGAGPTVCGGKGLHGRPSQTDISTFTAGDWHGWRRKGWVEFVDAAGRGRSEATDAEVVLQRGNAVLVLLGSSATISFADEMADQTAALATATAKRIDGTAASTTGTAGLDRVAAVPFVATGERAQEALLRSADVPGGGTESTPAYPGLQLCPGHTGTPPLAEVNGWSNAVSYSKDGSTGTVYSFAVAYSSPAAARAGLAALVKRDESRCRAGGAGKDGSLWKLHFSAYAQSGWSGVRGDGTVTGSSSGSTSWLAVQRDNAVVVVAVDALGSGAAAPGGKAQHYLGLVLQRIAAPAPAPSP